MNQKIFCPRCEEVYIPKKKCADVDGAYFGKSFPQLLLMQSHPDIAPKHQLLPDTKLFSTFEPTLYGFKIQGKNGSKFYKKEEEEQKQKSQINDFHPVEQQQKQLKSLQTMPLPSQQTNEPQQQAKGKKKNKKKQQKE